MFLLCIGRCSTSDFLKLLAHSLDSHFYEDDSNHNSLPSYLFYTFASTVERELYTEFCLLQYDVVKVLGHAHDYPPAIVPEHSRAISGRKFPDYVINPLPIHLPFCLSLGSISISLTRRAYPVWPGREPPQGPGEEEEGEEGGGTSSKEEGQPRGSQ